MVPVPGTSFSVLIEQTLEHQSSSATAYGEYKFLVDRVDDSGIVYMTMEFKRWRNPFSPGGLGEALQGQTVDLQMSLNGRIQSIEGTDALRENVRNRIQRPTRRSAERNDRFMADFTEEALMARLNSVFDVWPDVPVAPGDTWTRDPILHPNLSALENTTFTLKSWDAGKATVSFVSNFEPAPNSESKVVGGTSEGTVILLPTLGRISSYDAAQAIQSSTAGGGDPSQLRTSVSATFSSR